MLNRIQTFSNMPTPLKAGLLVASGGSMTAVIIVLLREHPQLLYVIFGGLAVVACLLLLYWRIVKFIRKRKAAPLERGLKENTSATPQEISDATRRADLDGLRKKFEEGVDTFRSAGKNLYAFPWYLIVGEPGSGKTEAIRHCNIGFPPGLQDEFQGAGGTLNMNWWFTDHAVILDTAGRLMFEEVQAGQSSEWVEFLRLLKKSRGNCPINGVLLAIPADSLIKDTADEIERKASKIARQFDLIQRTLDVRFPVFVVITKSDLITGFRDFFDKLEDPQLQHQILGWSNPSPLDEPYNPSFIEQHLKTIRGRLFRRRLALMRHMPGGDEMDAGLGQIDSLYAFPQGLSKLAPRMARYLELIFSVGNQWSGKPLFFRGIYFTSSMQEGSTLDEDLAEALGVPVDSLPDGRAWMRDRAYFLRDLFMKKIFQEKGLVTRATNARRQHTRHKAVVLCSGILSVLILIGFTIYTAWGFNSNIGRLESFFSKFTGYIRDVDRIKVVRDEVEVSDDFSGVKKIKFEYVGDIIVTGLGSVLAQATKTQEEDRILKSTYHVELDSAIRKWEETEDRWWLSKIAPGSFTSEDLRHFQKILYEQTVLVPFVDGARSKLMSVMSDSAGKVSDSEADIIKALMALKIEKAYSAGNFLDPYMAYIFEGETDALSDYDNDRKHLHQLLVNNVVEPPYKSLKDGFKCVEDENDSSLKFESIWVNWNNIDIAINEGCKRLVDQWNDLDKVIGEEESKNLKDLKDIADLLMEYNKAEEELLGADSTRQWNSKYDKLTTIKTQIDTWSDNNPEFAKLPAFKEKIESVYSALAVSSMKQLGPLQEMLKLEKSAKKANVLGSLDNAVGEAKEKVPGLRVKKTGDKPNDPGDYRSTLENAADRISDNIETKKQQLITEYKLWDELFWEATSKSQSRPYQERFAIYEGVSQLINKKGLEVVEDAPDSLDKIKEHTDKLAAEKEGEDDSDSKIGRDRFIKAMELCNKTVIRHALDNLPDEVVDLYGSSKPDASGVQKYDPDIAQKRILAWRRLEKYVSEDSSRKGDNVYQQYEKEYNNFWLNTYPTNQITQMIKNDLVEDNKKERWEDRRQWLANLIPEDAAGALGQLYLEVDKAIKVFSEPGSEIKRDSESVSADNLAKVISSWKRPGDISSGDSYNSLLMKNALLDMEPVDWIRSFCYIDKRERDAVKLELEIFTGLYLSEMAKEITGVLVADVENMRTLGIQSVKDLAASYFPFSRGSNQDINALKISQMKDDFAKLTTSQEWDRDSIGDGSDLKIIDETFKPGSDFADNMVEAIRDRQKDINDSIEKLRRGFQVSSEESKSIKEIQKLLDCLLEADKCTIKVASETLINACGESSLNKWKYREFRIRFFKDTNLIDNKTARKATANYGSLVLTEALPFDNSSFWVEVFPTLDDAPKTTERISEYERVGFRNAPRFGPFGGKFPFLRMIFSDDVRYKQSPDKRKWLVRFPLEYEEANGEIVNEALYLQLEFLKGDMPLEWSSLDEWPDK